MVIINTFSNTIIIITGQSVQVITKQKHPSQLPYFGHKVTTAHN